ncbi:MAG TPA: hypothetical protein VMB53_01850 [Gaiellaceae bacterium]|nr:hypothetical protein [Gaiellaceae bacterium]
MRIALATALVLAALVVAAPAGARTDAHRTNFWVLAVVSTGWDVELSQTQVAPTLYTLQVRNIGPYAARFTITAPGSKPLRLTVQPNGWAFPKVRMRPGTLAVKVLTQPGPQTYGASIPIQP